MSNILLVYESKYGATKGIAEEIAKTLAQEGHEIDVYNNPDDAPNPKSYDAAIVGSAVYAGRWRKRAVDFCRRYGAALNKSKLWLFSSGPLGLEDEQRDGAPVRLNGVVKKLKFRDHAIFAGKLEEDSVNVFERMIIKSIKAPMGDFRDWNAIGNWAKGVSKELK